MSPTFDDFFTRVSVALTPHDANLVKSAWQLTKQAHAGQRRQSGESYDTHPLAVADLVFDLLGADAVALCAALLHDVVEDSDTSLVLIAQKFGGNVARLVDGVSKLERVPTESDGLLKGSDGTLRKLVAAGGRDTRVFAVKLCDRLHNMRTLGSVGASKRRRVALETQLVYVPLARYVEFGLIASELEALSLRWLRPHRWALVCNWIRYKILVDRRRVSSAFGGLVWTQSSDAGQSDSRVANMMVVRCLALLRGDRACRALFAIPVVFVLCASIDEAFERIGVLHRKHAYLPASFTISAVDGTAASKFMVGEQLLVVDFVFFFPRVHQSSAQYAKGSNTLLRVDGDEEGDFATVAAIAEHGGDFTRVLRDLVQSASIAVFSPRGRKFVLPRHASGLDFAFAVHTDLGLRAEGVRINGRLCGAGTELSSGDVVDVVVSDQIVAKPEWEGVLRSPRARTKLRHWLRQARENDAILLGHRLLMDAVEPSERAELVTLLEDDSHAPAFGCIGKNDLLRRIGSGELSAFAVAARLHDSGVNRLLQSTEASDQLSRLLLNGNAVAGVEYCKLCMPVPSDSVVAVGSFAGGVMIHRTSCLNGAASRSASTFFRPIWSEKIACALPSKIRVVSADRRALLADCARTLSNLNVDVTSVASQSHQDNGSPSAVLDFTVTIKSTKTLNKCVRALCRVDGVRCAGRVNAGNTLL